MLIFIMIFLFHRMDVMVSVHILADAAKASCSTLRALQNLARGIRPKTPTASSVQNDHGRTFRKGIDCSRLLVI